MKWGEGGVRPKADRPSAQPIPPRRATVATLAPTTGNPVSGAYRVDISRGRNIGRVSSDWFSRPDDERYLSLTELYAAVRARADRSPARVVASKEIRVEARSDRPERPSLIVPGEERTVAPTNRSFGQLCSLVSRSEESRGGKEGVSTLRSR